MNIHQAAGEVITGFEAAGVILLTIGAILALIQCGRELLQRQSSSAVYRELRKKLGSAILLGLEFLVAADIIRTIAVEPTLENVVVLALIIVIRTFLSWSLEVEIEGVWPWQRASSFGATLDQSRP